MSPEGGEGKADRVAPTARNDIYIVLMHFNSFTYLAFRVCVSKYPKKTTRDLWITGL